MLLLLRSWFALAWSAPDCPEGTAPGEALLRALDEADLAMGELDEARFESAVAAALEVVGCLHEPVSPELASRLHRTVGLHAFAQRLPEAELAFAAARRAAQRAGRVPVLPEGLFPPGSPVREAWTAVPLAGLPLEVLPVPPRGALLLDGEHTLERARGLPVMLQWLDEQGQVGLSRYVGSEVDADSLYLPLAQDPRLSRTASTLQARLERHAPLLVTALGSGVAAASLWGLAVHGHARYLDLDDPVPDERLDGLRARTNALALASVGCAATTALTGAVIAVRW